MHKCSLFLSGTPFDVFTDHRPLVPIINQYTLDQIENPRLQRLILKLRPYQVRATWRKGSDNLFADALSRNPVQNPISDEEFGEDVHTAGASIRACIRRDDDGQITSIPHCELMEAARADESYQALVLAITDGFPSYRDLQPSLRPYWSIRAHLSTDSGVVLKGQRIVVPETSTSSSDRLTRGTPRLDQNEGSRSAGVFIGPTWQTTLPMSLEAVMYVNCTRRLSRKNR